MIMEEAPESLISIPLEAPRGLGLQLAVTANMPNRFQRRDFFAQAMAKIPRSVQALEEWTPRGGVTSVQANKRMKPFFVDGYSGQISQDTQERICAIGGIGSGQAAGLWGGLTPGNLRIYNQNPVDYTWVHEYGHFIDSNIGRLIPEMKWEPSNGTYWLTNTPEWNAPFWEAYLSYNGSFETSAYGFKSPQEWFAECFAAQCVTSYTGGFTKLLHVLCGRRDDLTGHVRAMFKQIIPDLPPFPWADGAFDARITPVITGLRMPSLRTGEKFSYTFDAEVAEAVTWSITDGALPAGMELTPEGTVKGTPQTPGTYSFKLTVANDNGSMTRTFAGRVFDGAVAKPVITSPSALPIYLQGRPYNVKLQATGSPTWSLVRNDKTAEIVIAPDGSISFPNGNYSTGSFVARATNDGGFVDGIFTFPYGAPPSFNTESIPDLRVGVDPGVVRIDTGGSFPMQVSLSAGAAPAGMTVTGGTTYTALLRGVPTTAGTYSITITATNEFGSESKTFGIRVLA